MGRKKQTNLWDQHPAVDTKNLKLRVRAADVLKKWFGTWTALFGIGIFITVWVALQTTHLKWDSYPYILLNLLLSCVAAVQGIILQISANRGDRISSEVALHTQTNTDELMELNRTQLEILNRVENASSCKCSCPKGD